MFTAKELYGYNDIFIERKKPSSVMDTIMIPTPGVHTVVQSILPSEIPRPGQCHERCSWNYRVINTVFVYP